MSWKKIKSFLILLFLIINLYLVYSTFGTTVKFKSVTEVDESTIDKTVSIISDNYDIFIDKSIVPAKLDNLNIIDVTNYIYADNIDSSKYDISTIGASFDVAVATNTYSYNEQKAREELVAILSNIGISEATYKLDFSKSDAGLVCVIQEYVSEYPVLNAVIKAEFIPTSIFLQGQWYFPQTNDIKEQDTTARMTDITSVLIDAAERASRGSAASIDNINYGYFVSSYAENTVSKISSAIPCYMIETDIGSKYFYDAYNGKFLKQED